MSNGNKPGTVIRRTWWHIRDIFHQLKPCRFSVTVVIIALPVFVCVAQGTEILRTVGEGTASGGQWDLVRVFIFFSALMLWATTSWYAARVLLYFDFPAQRGVARSKLAETQVPRILGVLPILIIGWGLVVASRSYDSAVPAHRWLIEHYPIPRKNLFGYDFTPRYCRPGKTRCPDKLFGTVHSQATIAAWVEVNV